MALYLIALHVFAFIGLFVVLGWVFGSIPNNEPVNTDLTPQEKEYVRNLFLNLPNFICHADDLDGLILQGNRLGLSISYKRIDGYADGNIYLIKATEKQTK